MKLDADYWNQRYEAGNTPWDTGEATPPLRAFIDSLEDKSLKILVPGAGNGHEVKYLYSNGFKNVWVCDWAATALSKLKASVPDIPDPQLLAIDYFKLNLSFDLILEQTFFCSFHPSKRAEYTLKTADLLHNQGRVAGVLFAEHFPFQGPPFGGTKEKYQQLFDSRFHLEKLEMCYNSIKPRQGKELFFNFLKK